MNEDNDIIETSADTEDEGKSGLYPYDPTQADIDIRETPHTIFELMRKYDDKRLIDYQSRVSAQLGFRNTNRKANLSNPRF